MFAGAAREAVFSKADVIRRINANFVPVALKAALVNNPPDGDEGRLYREIRRSRIAPQGICVVNSAGKVLDWVLMFDDEKSVLNFLDHALARYARYPGAKQAVAAQRYMRFPGRQLADVEDSGAALEIPDLHAQGEHCPGTPPLPEGTAEVRLVGRALDEDGRPVGDTVRQEHYVEDLFHLSVRTQQRLAGALDPAGRDRVRVPVEVVSQLVMHAYLGVLDVQPLSNPGRSKGELKKCSFWASPAGNKKGVSLWRVEGESETFNGEGMANAGPGDMHEVKLSWRGFIEMKGNRMTQLVLSADGAEKLKFGSARGKIENEVAHLPGGRRIDLQCGVRYGIIAEPTSPK